MVVRVCSDCGVEMEVGYVPEHVHGGAAIRGKWYAGLAEPMKFFGMRVGAGIRVATLKNFPITTYRCPKCGVLKMYALKGEGSAEPGV